MTEPAAVTCLNCGQRFAGAFCPACGQKAATGRLRLGDILGDAVAQIFNVDAKVPRTVIGLTLRPGRVCRDYVQGRRVGYVPPFRYCLVLLTLTVLANLAIGFDPTSLTPRADLSPLQEEIRRIVAGYAVRHLDLVVFAVMPAFILMVRLLFRGAGFTYAEVSAFVLFVLGHILFFGLLLAPLKMFLPLAGVLLKLAVHVAYFSWAATVFFQARPLGGMVRSVVATAGYLVLVMLVIAALVLPQVAAAVRAAGGPGLH